MKVIDTFLYSDPCELPALEVKIASESCPDLLCWVVVENCYSFQGRYKGYTFESVAANSRILLIHKHKIMYVKVSIAPSFSISTISHNARLAQLPSSAKVFRRCEEEAFRVEYSQRNAVLPALRYIASRLNEKAAVLISDADELVDLSDPDKHHLIMKALAAVDGSLTVRRFKYQYDFDNTWPESQTRLLCFCSLDDLVKERISPHQVRYQATNPYFPNDVMLAFEYSYCFSPSHILSKLSSFSHVRPFVHSDITRSLLLNMQIYAGKPSAPLLFETIVLTDHNSPSYVRKHLAMLKTHIVNPNYLQARATDL